jgi:phospholipid/cholesterol/gamma-HCH transport system ATP-binding protein
MALFEIRGVHKRFGDAEVLRGIDLDIHEGEFLTVIGRSGSGKSVLMKCLIGLHRPERGSILFDGEELVGKSEVDWVETRRDIGMLFQEGALFDSLSVADNVSYALREQRLMPEPQIAERVADSLRRVSLPGIEDMAPADLSGGMRKRVALARAIALRPRVVLYDEPTEGLDPINVTRVNRLLNDLRKNSGVTTVVVTHNMQSAFSVSDRVAFIDEGRVVAVGSPQELLRLDEPRLKPFRAASRLEARVRTTSVPPPPRTDAPQ